MRVLAAMSGGVDSSVAAALLLEAGHEVVGVTLKLWGGAQDSGCCSVGDVEDARRVAQQLGIVHHVFNFTEDFETSVVSPYVRAHASGLTPNPCVECNRHIKFDRLMRRADQLGFAAVATGHHARVAEEAGGRRRLLRGADPAKDQSYVLHMLGQRELHRVVFPVGSMTKAEVRARAQAMGLRTAAKAESQDTCFVTATGGRATFLGTRVDLHSGRVVDGETGAAIGTVPAVELVTVGQRRGLGLGAREAAGQRRYALAVDIGRREVLVGPEDRLFCRRVDAHQWTWVDSPAAAGTPVVVQASAHGCPAAGTFDGRGIAFDRAQRRVAPGQAVVLYDAETGAEVLGGGVAA